LSAPPDRRLRNAWQGALAGGGDPASSPLYVFGPFLSLIVGAGVAAVTFGPSIWLAVVTITVVALLYRLVMRWVVDGSGGTGLSEEELGPWAAKISAAITCTEYTLTFLVSIAALVTFVADRIRLDQRLLGLEARSLFAIVVAVVCAALVSRGPRIVSYVFGPATGAVLALLWIMMIATIARRGLDLAPFDLDAFRFDYLGYTLAGFARILALMTGIEVFANLVPAYAGPPAVRSRLAFRSLSIIMGSTALTMVIVGPAVRALADVRDPDVSVFTQTMDALLPRPLALAGTVVGVLVLLSAAAASALGIQNLFLGLSVRHYAPTALGHRNAVGIASRPVWVEALVAVVCFVVLGTKEGTYLAVYAAGVFVLLSMTGWAAVLRVRRHRREGAARPMTVAVVGLAALFTTLATVVIFIERFADGVWIYAILVPVMAGAFGWVRRERGAPGPAADRVGRLLAGWKDGRLDSLLAIEPADLAVDELAAQLRRGDSTPRDVSTIVPVLHAVRPAPASGPWRVSAPLDGSKFSEAALGYVAAIARYLPVQLVLVHVHQSGDEQPAHDYLGLVAISMRTHVETVTALVIAGEPAPVILAHAKEHDVALVVMTSHARSGYRRRLAGSVAREVVAARQCSVLTVPPVARREI
jgi:nucleotide-binding universal stress UspA family protein